MERFRQATYTHKALEWQVSTGIGDDLDLVSERGKAKTEPSYND